MYRVLAIFCSLVVLLSGKKWTRLGVRFEKLDLDAERDLSLSIPRWMACWVAAEMCLSGLGRGDDVLAVSGYRRIIDRWDDVLWSRHVLRTYK